MQARVKDPRAVAVDITEDELTVHLEDGRTITTPLAWYPRLVHGTSEERNNFQIIGHGTSIHWPDLDEDLSIEGMLNGRPSQESRESLKRWLDARG